MLELNRIMSISSILDNLTFMSVAILFAKTNQKHYLIAPERPSNHFNSIKNNIKNKSLCDRHYNIDDLLYMTRLQRNASYRY